MQNNHDHELKRDWEKTKDDMANTVHGAGDAVRHVGRRIVNGVEEAYDDTKDVIKRGAPALEDELTDKHN